MSSGGKILQNFAGSSSICIAQPGGPSASLLHPRSPPADVTVMQDSQVSLQGNFRLDGVHAMAHGGCCLQVSITAHRSKALLVS